MRGPAPSHMPRFKREDIELAEETIRHYTKEYQQVVRAKLALVLASDPTISHEAAATQVGLSVPAVRKWRRRWALFDFSLADAPRPGRPRSFSPSGEDGGKSACL